jgi:hypothetical protein
MRRLCLPVFLALAIATPAFAQTATVVAPPTGVVNPASGAVGDMLYFSAARTLSKLPAVATGSVLCSAGVITAPAWCASPTLTRVFTGDGTAAAPSIAFTTVPTTGFIKPTGSFSAAAIDVVGSGSIISRLSDGGGIVTTGITFSASQPLAWNSTTLAQGTNSSPDLYLFRDAADVLAQRRGTNAQAFRLYKTYTDSSNNEYLHTFADSNGFHIRTIKAGTGTQRNLYFGGSGGDNWYVDTSGRFNPNGDNNYPIGTTGERVSTVFAYTGNFTTSAVTPLVDSGSDVDLALQTNSAVRWRVYHSTNTYSFGPNTNNAYDLGVSNTTVRTGYFGTNVSTPMVNSASGSLQLGAGHAVGDWQITTAGDLSPTSDNVYDLGRTGATRPRIGYFGTGVVIGATNPAATGSLRFSNNDSGIKYRNAANGADLLAMYTNGSNALLIGNDNGFSGGVTVGSASAAVTIPNVASVSGFNYVCSNSSGVLSKNNTSCVGTEVTVAAFSRDGFHLPSFSEWSAMQRELTSQRALIAELQSQVIRK